MLKKNRTNSSILEKNGMLNVSTTNGYSHQMNSVGSSSRTYVNRSPHNLQQQSHQPSFQAVPELRRIDDNVIRLPKGPSGPGFMLKR